MEKPCARPPVSAGDSRVAEMYELQLEPGKKSRHRHTVRARANRFTSPRDSLSSKLRAIKRRSTSGTCCFSALTVRIAITTPDASLCAASC